MTRYKKQENLVYLVNREILLLMRMALLLNRGKNRKRWKNKRRKNLALVRKKKKMMRMKIWKQGDLIRKVKMMIVQGRVKEFISWWIWLDKIKENILCMWIECRQVWLRMAISKIDHIRIYILHNILKILIIPIITISYKTHLHTIKYRLILTQTHTTIIITTLIDKEYNNILIIIVTLLNIDSNLSITLKLILAMLLRSVSLTWT